MKKPVQNALFIVAALGFHQASMAAIADGSVIGAAILMPAVSMPATVSQALPSLPMTLAVGPRDRVDRRQDHRQNAGDRADDKQDFRQERRDCTGNGADCRSDNRQDKRSDSVDRAQDRVDDRQDRRF